MDFTDSFDKKANKANIRISHAINDATSLNKIMLIHNENLDWFNLINYSVLLNVLSKINQPDQSQKIDPKNLKKGYQKNLDLNNANLNELELSFEKNLFITKEQFDEIFINLKKRLLKFPEEITGRKLANLIFYIGKIILNQNSIISNITSPNSKNDKIF
jgi:hypothetical protein